MKSPKYDDTNPCTMQYVQLTTRSLVYQAVYMTLSQWKGLPNEVYVFESQSICVLKCQGVLRVVCLPCEMVMLSCGLEIVAHSIQLKIYFGLNYIRF